MRQRKIDDMRMCKLAEKTQIRYIRAAHPKRRAGQGPGGRNPDRQGAGWLLLRSDIQPDGNAKLDAKDLTGDPTFDVKSVQRGVPYAYQVAARFEGKRGTGRRLRLRECAPTFVKR